MEGKRKNERIRNKIVGMYREFISEVDPRNVLDLLIQKEIISNEEKDEVMNRKMRHDQCRALLDRLLYCSHDESFLILREALKEHYPRILERIDALDADNTEGETVSSSPSAVIDHSMCIEQQRERLIEIIETESGVPGKLLTLGALTSDQLEQIQSETTRQKKNEMILYYIRQTRKYDNLITALTKSGQTHVVNWIRGNGEYKDEFGLDWPLTDKEKTSLDSNYEVLVDLLDTSELLFKLYSQRIINNRQKDLIDSQSSSYKRNEALLGIVRRFSRKSYLTLMNCLRETNQAHIANIFESDDIIVRAHATLESDNLDETETQIVHEMTNLLMNRNVSMEQANRLLAATQLNIIAVKRGESIVLYIPCNKENEFARLCEVLDKRTVRDNLEQLFNLLIHNLKVKVLSVTIREKDIEKAKKSFEEAVIDYNLYTEQQRERLIEIIEPEFGLLGRLLILGALTRDQLELIQRQLTKAQKNKMILDHIRQTGKYDNLITALTDSCQTHVVNWIKGNGEYKDEFVLDWPLTDTENKTLDSNYEVLVDLLDTLELLPMLYSQQIINRRQKEFIDSLPFSSKRNEELLGIIRRFSRKSYFTLLNCLRETNQDHIVEILKNTGVIVRAHATLESDNLDATETQIVNEMTNLLMNRNVSMEQANRLLAATQLNIIAAKRGESIVLYISCNKEAEFVRLCETIDNPKLRQSLEHLFNFFIHNLKIKILSVIIKQNDIKKAKQSFEGGDSLFL